VWVAASTPETVSGLYAFNPEMAKLLAVVALCNTILGFIRPWKGDKEEGKCDGIMSFLRRWMCDCHLFNADNVEVNQPGGGILYL
jgi:hypothetical protein